MLMEQTIEKMKSMRLLTMARSLQARLENKEDKKVNFADFMGLLVDDEFSERQNQKIQSRLQSAKFKESSACLEKLDYEVRSESFKKSILELSSNQWAKRNQNIFLTGPSGVGKSFIAQSLGNNACRNGLSTKFFRAGSLYQMLSVARVDGTLINKMRLLQKTNILIIDDFGLTSMTNEIRQDLFELIEDRHGSGSTIFTSQLPVEKWHEYLGGGMIGDGICDRLIHNAIRLNLQGESMRKKSTKLTESGQ
jgi:DNA replication protein DnaC